jgi:hypothetical protein
MATVRKKHELVKYTKSILDYHDSIAIVPLQEIVFNNQEAISSIEKDIINNTISHEKIRKEVQDIQSKIQQTKQQVNSGTGITYQKLDKQRKQLQTEIDTLKKNIIKQDRASDQTTEQLDEKDIIEVYTEKLTKMYYDEYKTKADKHKVQSSAKFLADQSLVVENIDDYIRITAKLIHEFKAGLDSFFFNKETFQIEIETSTNRRDLVPLKLSPYGNLVLENDERSGVPYKKLKCSIIASQEDNPHKWILSRRSSQAYGKRLFASKTLMQQSGNIDFKDFFRLNKKNMNISHKAITREFEEETRGEYKLLPETIESSGERSTPTEYIIFFRAKAKKVKEPTTSPEQAFEETTGTYILDAKQLAKDNDSSPFFRKQRYSKIKEALLKTAGEEFSEQDNNTRNLSEQDYYNSYNVNKMVDAILAITDQHRIQAQGISWRIRGNSRWR